jgi:hypothetical protein
MFDGERWIVSEEALGLGAFKYAEASKEVTPRLEGLTYGEKPIKFDQADFIIAYLRVVNARTKNFSIREVLRQNNHDLSLVTISKRATALKKAGVFHPTSSFTGLGLRMASVFAVECDNRTLETFYHMFPMVPQCVASRTDKGVVFMVRTTADAAPAISYLMRGLEDEVDNLITANRLENIGTRWPGDLYKHWNDEEQYWEFERGHFDLTKSHSLHQGN